MARHRLQNIHKDKMRLLLIGSLALNAITAVVLALWLFSGIFNYMVLNAGLDRMFDGADNGFCLKKQYVRMANETNGTNYDHYCLRVDQK